MAVGAYHTCFNSRVILACSETRVWRTYTKINAERGVGIIYVNLTLRPLGASLFTVVSPLSLRWCLAWILFYVLNPLLATLPITRHLTIIYWITNYLFIYWISKPFKLNFVRTTCKWCSLHSIVCVILLPTVRTLKAFEPHFCW